jgi:hypothetical protein
MDREAVMDEEDWGMVALLILILGLTGIVAWVLIELGVYLHGLNGW